jgi:hypothetical protein
MLNVYSSDNGHLRTAAAAAACQQQRSFAISVPSIHSSAKTSRAQQQPACRYDQQCNHVHASPAMITYGQQLDVGTSAKKEARNVCVELIFHALLTYRAAAFAITNGGRCEAV